MIERRTALGLLAGAAGAAAFTSAPAVARAGTGAALTSRGFDPNDPEHLALAFRKLAYSVDDHLTFWWMQGTRYGVQGSLTTPFWEMHIATWFTTRDLGDGRYEVKSAGANLYTLPGETTLLEKFRNPFTGAVVDIPYGKPQLARTVFDREGSSPVGSPGIASTTHAKIGPAWVRDDELTVRHDVMFRAEPRDPGKRGFIAQDMSTYVGSLADVMNPKVTNAPCSQMFNDILDYPPYLKMGDQPGTYFSRCYGRKVFRYEQMPAIWRSLFEARFPDVAKDPGALLQT